MSSVAVGGAWSPRRWAGPGVLLAAGFMDLLDTTVVNVASRRSAADLRASYASIQWIVAGYLLARGGRPDLRGAAGRRPWTQPVFVVGVVAFGLAPWPAASPRRRRVWSSTRVLQGLARR